MLKRLAIVASYAILTVCVSGQPNKASDPNQNPANPKQPVIVKAAPEKQSKPGADKTKVDPDLPKWYAPVERPDWWLVVLGFGTLVIVGWQTKILGKSVGVAQKAADAAEKQIALQSAALRQWVNVVPLGISIPRTLENPCKVTIQFEIQNKTDYLVTIKAVEFELIPNIHAIGKFKVDCDFPLVPRKSENDSAFPFAGECVVDIAELDGSGKIFIVGGDVKFLDCMEREQVQTFQDLYRGYIDGRLERMKPASIQNTEDEFENQNPNPN